jgi:hypothetical protein
VGLDREAVRAQDVVATMVTMRFESAAPCRVWTVAAVHQLETEVRIVYSGSSNLPVSPVRGGRAIGGGACAGGWTIGGDALAMQVHAGGEHTYRF